MLRAVKPWMLTLSALILFILLPVLKTWLDGFSLYAQERTWDSEEADPDQERLQKMRYRSLQQALMRVHSSYSVRSLSGGGTTEDNLALEEMLREDPYDFTFSEKAWYRYHEDEGLRDLEEIPEEHRDIPHLVDIQGDVVKLRVFGKTNVRASYGTCWFLSDADRRSDTEECSTDAINKGFKLEMDMKVKIKGKIGRKVTVDIDYDKNEKETQNTFKVQYKALRKREFVQEVTIGNIDLVFPKSEFAVFEQRSKQTVGVEGKMQRGKLSFHTIATLTRGESQVDRFNGSTRTTSGLISEFNFVPRKYYQIEPYIYFGDADPTSCSQASVSAGLATAFDRTSASSFRTFTSRDPKNFFPQNNVNIDSDFELYLDDRDPTNNVTSYDPAPTGTSLGNFTLLQIGRDYTFNTRSGRLVMTRFLGSNYKLLARYTRNNGDPTATCDPSARTNVAGKIEVMIKWDGIMNEDQVAPFGTLDTPIISDGVTNYDAYEIRGFYDLSAQEINQEKFQVTLLNRNLQNLTGLDTLGELIVAYESGQMNFSVREPFKQLKDSANNFILSDTSVSSIYTESQPGFVSDNSEVIMRTDFTHNVRNYKLSRFNILNGSERVKVNGLDVPNSKYFIDYQSGYFSFIDASDPVITTSTPIEINYEYSPFGSTAQGYIVGLRSDYQANRDVKIGSTVLYNGQFQPSQAPQVGQEPISRLVFETDIDMKFKEEKITRMLNTIPGLDFDLLPVRFEAYAEYARSFYNPNTFGLALIDDLESSEEVSEVSVLDKEWQLSGVPAALTSTGFCDQGQLLYRYYRDPSDFAKGLLTFSDGARSSPDYNTLAGPYSVAEGHLDASQLNTSQAEKQESLVMDFDFSLNTAANNSTGTPFVSAVTRDFGSIGRDFSNVNYLEFYANFSNAVNLSSGVKLFVEIGTVKEDADADGNFDTEDIGLDGLAGTLDAGEGNYRLDREKDTGNDEDRGYQYNPGSSCGSMNTATRIGAGPGITTSTLGNGVLNGEDLDRDGVLTTTDSVLTLDASNTTNFYLDKGPASLPPNSGWQLVRLYIRHTSLTDAQKLILKKVRSVRVFITPVNNAEKGSGRVLIDSLRFGGSKWRNIHAVAESDPTKTEVALDNPQFFRVTTIDNFAAKDEYNPESFITQQRDVYESLHGKKTNAEIGRTREAALKINYQLDTGTTRYTRAFARRIFINSMDLRYYGKMNLWINYRPPQPAGHTFFMRVGSSDDDYVEFRKPVEGSGWKRLEMPFSSPDGSKGKPNLKEVNTIVLGLDTASPTTTASELWINDIYVSDPEVQSDDAYKYEATVRITKPMMTTPAGVPILSDIETTYKRKHKGRRFASIGQTESNQDEDRTEWRISSQVLPFWQAGYSYTLTTTRSDDNETFQVLTSRGYSENTSHSTDHRFQFQNPHVPKVNISYNYNHLLNIREETLSDPLNPRTQNIHLEEDTYSPTILVDEKFPDIGESKLSYQVKSSLRFFRRQETTSLLATSITPTTDTLTRREKEQSEDTSNKFTVQMGNFTLSPSYTYRQVKLIEKDFPDTSVNLKTVHGNFYAPYVSEATDFRYRQRQTDYQLQGSYSNLWALSPNFTLSASYQENSFKDNPLTYTGSRYQRLKTPSTLASTNIALPLDFSRMSAKLKFIKSFTPTFTREVTYAEQAVPFTEKSGLYEDDQGIKRSLPPLADRAYNLIKFPFWEHFLSSPDRSVNNFSNGREYVQLNRLQPTTDPAYPAAFAAYDNSLTLNENVNTSAQWDIYDPLNLRTDVRLNQNVNRTNLTGLPVHNAGWGYSVLQSYNLMKIMNFWFWADKSHNSSFELNYSFDQSRLITQNRREDSNNPETAVTFQWFGLDRALNSITLRFGVIFRVFDEEKYIQGTPANDAVIYRNIPDAGLGVREENRGYKTSIEYATELPGMRRFLQQITGLTLRYNPKYTVTLSAEINRSEYAFTKTSRPDIRDRFKLEQKLDANLHSNVTGGLDFTAVWDVLRNPFTNLKSQEVIGVQIGFFARILF